MDQMTQIKPDIDALNDQLADGIVDDLYTDFGVDLDTRKPEFRTKVHERVNSVLRDYWGSTREPVGE